MFKANSKDTKMQQTEVVAVSFGVNQTQNQPPEIYKKTVLKNFAIFTGKQLCWNFL